MPRLNRVFIPIVVFFVLLFFICAHLALNKAKLSAINLVRFPLCTARFVSSNLKNFVEYRLYSKHVKENMELKGKLSGLSYEITKLKELEAENKRLKELLDFKGELHTANIPARIIGVDSALLSRTILIDRGKKDGIETGVAVISKEGVVGKVIEINSNISRVMLLEDPNFRLGVIVQRTREQALFVGRPHGEAKVIYLDPNSDIKKGDSVISYPNNRIFPKGLLLGYIKDIKSESISLYKYATVELVVDYSRLEEVICIK